MQLRQMHMDYWQERAEKVLSHFDYTYPDDIDIFQICWRYGIKVLPLDKPFLESHGLKFDDIEGLKAYSVPKKKARRGTIFLKEHLPHVERKLLVAEEFCHLYAHHSPQLIVDEYVLDKNEQQAKSAQRFIEKVYDFAEDEAVSINDIADYFMVTEDFAHLSVGVDFST